MSSSESAGPMSASIQVDLAKVIGKVHPHIFGHFIEHLEDCIYNGLWAELLQNRKMAGHDATYYGVVAGWKPVGTDTVRIHRRPYRGDDEQAHHAGPVAFVHDNTQYYVAGDFGRGQAQRVDIRRALNRPCGIGQDHLGLRAGQPYIGYVVLRARAITRATIALGNQTHEIEGIGDEWQQFPFTFVPDSAADDALFSITTDQPGTLWIGLASLMPGDNQAGWRRDVCDLARALKPPIIRYPGGNFASAYHWLYGIGERDRRPVRLDRAWQTFEPNDVGTDEFMTLCRLLDAEPYLCVNMGDGTPEEAAAWVEYCNGPLSSHYGGMRAANGHPEPYNVIYWGLGNEVYGNWQVGHVDAETYAHDCVKWARAMRAADPGGGQRLKLLAVGATPDFWPEWNEAVVRIAGEHIDYITLHHYAQADEDASRDDQYWLAVTAPSRIGDLIAAARTTIDAHAAGGKRIPISFDEWNVIHRHAKYPRVTANGDWPAIEHQALFTTLGEQVGVARQEYALVDGLYAALFFNVLLRNADHVTMANQAQLVNLFGLIETGPVGAYGTAEYHAFRLYVEQSGPIALTVRVDSPTFEVRATGNLPARQGEPYLDVAATRDDARRKLWLHVVNRHPREAIAARIEVGADITEAVHHILGGGGPWTRNSLTDPDAVAVHSASLDWVGSGPLTFPSCSASSIELTLAEP